MYISLYEKKGVKNKFKKENLVKLLLPKLAGIFFNLIAIGPRLILRSAMQLLRVNIWTRMVSTIALIIIDLYNYIKKRISTRQFIINLILSFTLLIGGTAGWTVGTNTALFIVAENTILWIIFGILGAGLISGFFDFIVKKILGKFLKTDVDEMLFIFNEQFGKICDELKIKNEEEKKQIAKKIKVTKNLCISCYSQKDKNKFAKEYIKNSLKL